MNTAFPFGFPAPTAFYLTLYVVTLVIHVVLMNYVLAGGGWLALSALMRQTNPSSQTPDQLRSMGSVLRDWLPFALGAAITAGVAPLLFIQILYRQPFYTANLLLFHRWMAILPVLIAAFYLLYLGKSKRFAGGSKAIRLGVGLATFVCFAFVAYSWTENHLLSIQPSSQWIAHWEKGRTFYVDPALAPRLGVWFLGAAPTMALLLAWQLRHYHQQGDVLAGHEPKRLSVIALTGLLGAGLCTVLYDRTDEGIVRAAVVSPLATPYFIAALIGVVLQIVGWVDQMRQHAFCKRALIVITIGLILTVVGMTVVRESIRLHTLAASIDLETLYAQHTRSAQVGGLTVFLLFFVLNAGVIVWCVNKVRIKAM